jgi:hypothetical protein
MREHHVQRERAYDPLFVLEKVRILRDGRWRGRIEVEFARGDATDLAGPYARGDGSLGLLALLDVREAGRAAPAA